MIVHKYFGRQNVASDQDLHCLPQIQQILVKSAGNSIHVLLKF